MAMLPGDGTPVRGPQLADWALAHGLTALTTAEVAQVLGVEPDRVRQRLSTPVKRGEWVSLGRGLWVPVRPEFRAVGGPPGVELIRDLASHLGFVYYVGWLSAAARYGAAHHAPQVFQVAASRTVSARTVGRVRMEFHQRDRVAKVPIQLFRTYGGDVPFSTPAVTALDAATDLDLVGGLDNAATIIIDLASEADLRAAEVADAAQWFPVASVRRVGWVMESFANAPAMGALRDAVETDRVPPSLLDPGRPRRGRTDPRWNLVINTEVEPDT
jgi:predicted transcriptional regulator of viral defense system